MSQRKTNDDSHLQAAIRLVEDARVGSACQPIVKGFFDEVSFTVTYVVHDPATSEAAIIDSVLDYDPEAGRTSFAAAEKVVDYVRESGLTVGWLIETHAHADHLSAAPYLQAKLGGKLAIGEHITKVQQVFGKMFNAGISFERDGSQFDHLFKDGETFRLGSVECIVLHVPGHTPADMAFVVGDAVFAGDTFFMPDYGTARADFPGGDAGALYRSIRRLLSLPRETRLFMCHDYKAPGRDEYLWETSVAEQRDGNVHVHDGVSEEAFVAMRNARDATLPVPRLILPSVQVNMRAGHMPEPEGNGVRYLKIPIDVI